MVAGCKHRGLSAVAVRRYFEIPSVIHSGYVGLTHLQLRTLRLGRKSASRGKMKPLLSHVDEPMMPSPITPGLYRHFVCPLCMSDDYLYSSYVRQGKPTARMSWFKCAGCSVMFDDPERFSRLVRRTRDQKWVTDIPQRGEGPLMSKVQRMQQERDERKSSPATDKE